MSSAQPQLKANLYKPASGSSRLASRISLRLGPSSTSGDRERSISNARASTGGRSAEVGLNVGSFTLDLEHDVGGEKESYDPAGVNEKLSGKWKKERYRWGTSGRDRTSPNPSREPTSHYRTWPLA